MDDRFDCLFDPIGRFRCGFRAQCKEESKEVSKVYKK